MRNLAGKRDCDLYITKELNKASIPIVAMDLRKAEVSASVGGRLGSFVFDRRWYYWAVNGLVPLYVAKKMYWHPAGRRAVRAVGHCGCPHPNSWAKRLLPDGIQIWPESQRAESEAMKARHPDWFKDDKDIFSDDKTLGRLYVTNYHIDTQEGLNLFAKMLRRHGLVP